MNRRPEPSKNHARPESATTDPRYARDTPTAWSAGSATSGAQQVRCAEIARAQATLKRELTRVYAQVCGASARKD